MQMNPHMPGGMMPMAPVQQGVPVMPPMSHPGQMPMMAYGQQPQQQAYMPVYQPQAHMPGAVMPPPPPPPPQMQMQPGPMDMQFMMQQQQSMLHHQHPQHQRHQQQHHGGGGGGGSGSVGQNPKGRVFIGNLNTNELGRSDLERIFSKYGSLTEINVHNGFAFVQFVDEPSARSACQREDGRVYAGQTLDVNIASEPKNRRDRHGGGTSISSSASSVVGSVGGGGSVSGSVSLSVKDRLGPRRHDDTSFDSVSSKSSVVGGLGISRDGRQIGRDYLVCGNCKDTFDNVDRLSSHKQDGCRRRFVCRCKLLGEPRTLDCAKCGRQFLSSWELLRHCQSEHEIGVYSNCVFAPGSVGSESASSAAAVAGSSDAAGGGEHSELNTAAESVGADSSAGLLTTGDLSNAASSVAQSDDAGGVSGGAAADATVGGGGGGGSGRRRRGEMDDDEPSDEDEEEDEEGSEKND